MPLQSGVSFRRIRHNFPPLLERSPPYSAHAFLHLLAHCAPIHSLQLLHVAFQFGVPSVLDGLPESSAYFSCGGWRERGLGLDDVGEEEGLLVQEKRLLDPVACV